MIAVNHNSINWVLTRSLEVSGDSHVEILLQHSICPVLFHLGGVKFVFFLVDEAQMSGQTSFVVLNADNISTGPVSQKRFINKFKLLFPDLTCRFPFYFPPRRTARSSLWVSLVDRRQSSFVSPGLARCHYELFDCSHVLVDYWPVLVDCWPVLVGYWPALVGYWPVLIEYWLVLVDCWVWEFVWGFRWPPPPGLPL